MKKILTLTLLLSFVFMMGCSDNTKKVDEFDTVTTYLEGQSADYGQWVNTLSGWIVNYSGLNLDNYFILDLRSATDFASFHLDNAHNSTIGNIFTTVKGAEKPVLCVCYTGQTASYAHTLLRMKGVEAYVLKFGMSIVDATLDKWTGNCSNQYATSANWSMATSATLPSFGYPTLNTGKDNAEDILNDRLAAATSDWSTRLINASDVVGNPDNYNIMTYWSASEYAKYGHIKGAFQLTPQTLTKDANLSVFDPNGSNILYCYTGQTAAATIAYLDVLGYDVKSIKFGTCSMIWDKLEAHKWPKPWQGN